jgi:hypothetical protein
VYPNILLDPPKKNIYDTICPIIETTSFMFKKKLDIPKIELERAVASSNDGSAEIVVALVDRYYWNRCNTQSILQAIGPNARCIFCGDSANHIFRASKQSFLHVRKNPGTYFGVVLPRCDNGKCFIRSREIAYHALGTKRMNAANRQCSNCFAIEYSPFQENGFQSCSRCTYVHYCSEDCQRSHWKEHKVKCRSPFKYDLSKDKLREIRDTMKSDLIQIGKKVI